METPLLVSRFQKGIYLQTLIFGFILLGIAGVVVFFNSPKTATKSYIFASIATVLFIRHLIRFLTVTHTSYSFFADRFVSKNPFGDVASHYYSDIEELDALKADPKAVSIRLKQNQVIGLNSSIYAEDSLDEMLLFLQKRLS